MKIKSGKNKNHIPNFPFFANISENFTFFKRHILGHVNAQLYPNSTVLVVLTVSEITPVRFELELLYIFIISGISNNLLYVSLRGQNFFKMYYRLIKNMDCIEFL